jgi:hypothetical protein
MAVLQLLRAQQAGERQKVDDGHDHEHCGNQHAHD